MSTWFKNAARSVFYAERLLWPALLVGVIVAGTALAIGERIALRALLQPLVAAHLVLVQQAFERGRVAGLE